jgi:hypothetical protein
LGQRQTEDVAVSPSMPAGATSWRPTSPDSCHSAPHRPTRADASVIPGRGYTLQFSGTVPLHPRLTLPYPQAALRVIRDYNSSQALAQAADVAELDASAGDRY